MTAGKIFTEQDASLLEEFILHRRDVRGNRFLEQAVEDEILERLLFAALNAPSVGFSQPWEFVIVRDPVIKEQIKLTFSEENSKAIDLFSDKKKQQYTQLKLEGITEAPVNIAVFYKAAAGPVLGQTSMEEVGLYSVVCAIQNMWLMARALNIGMGWVSILDADKVKKILCAPETNKLVAYLCIGYVDQFFTRPELEILQWEKRKEKEAVVFYDGYK